MGQCVVNWARLICLIMMISVIMIKPYCSANDTSDNLHNQRCFISANNGNLSLVSHANMWQIMLNWWCFNMRVVVAYNQLSLDILPTVIQWSWWRDQSPGRRRDDWKHHRTSLHPEGCESDGLLSNFLLVPQQLQRLMRANDWWLGSRSIPLKGERFGAECSDQMVVMADDV